MVIGKDFQNIFQGPLQFYNLEKLKAICSVLFQIIWQIDIIGLIVEMYLHDNSLCLETSKFRRKYGSMHD